MMTTQILRVYLGKHTSFSGIMHLKAHFNSTNLATLKNNC